MNTFVIPDLHLGLIWDGLDRTPDVFKALEDIKTFILKETQNLEGTIRLIFLGDIFDSPNVSYQLVCEFISYLRSFDGRFITYILRGNHDGEKDSRKGSPLQLIEAAVESAIVVWEPRFFANEVLIPYCPQEELDSFINNSFIPSIKAGDHYKRAFTHVDITGIIRGFEQQIGKGVPCILSDNIIKNVETVYAGHIHEPQKFNNIEIVGSIIKCDRSEHAEKRMLWLNNDTPLWVMIDSRPISHYDLNYADNNHKAFLNKLQQEEFKGPNILSLNITVPHNIAHEVDQIKIKNNLKSKYYYVRCNFNIVKEKQIRMKELDNNLTDYQVVNTYLEKQGISDKDLILKDLEEIIK